ncbi:AraC family transcriptional regulator of adaptative response / methylphosphotriester-DNA alkyltransferase methyltransferase [Paenibacillus sp. SORGH_AS306]|uniref:bifunctional transcriptional activator/DNA repair enzyme AdaA n=1 Tax=unclassified Paenibacillus TaxID=185978 RepID=UPI002789E84A|nr:MULTISPECIES: bifunctional transcriptional activator/DNA repair enzyme AdaA [unclassified Paenibacillus]MDQ1234619.1 AraC family transcriptional regulator of adaptative response / methylphosphotriester-DNA alkyltransferase methyltransferase [Paenibacillus sp. SORGH_AS_0306]MDR6111664.1 AraC family transcriptional regulator of adaptative response / methylphosphotriester-DNA alkyltransferase methyltransferase [Paenibacillus sp. SORGH_AS_0338]
MNDTATHITDSPHITTEQWQAIVNNDSSYDGQFWYAVRTTGIFCRPSCKSKAPRPQNVTIFADPDQALHAQYRPCKRCKPTGERLPDQEWIAVITQYIDQHYTEPLTLHGLAEIGHGSPYHLHRTFKKVMNITPVEYIQRCRIDQACQELITTNHSMTAIGLNIGIPNTSYFVTLFKKKIGITPAQYRKQHHADQSVKGE